MPSIAVGTLYSVDVEISGDCCIEHLLVAAANQQEAALMTTVYLAQLYSIEPGKVVVLAVNTMLQDVYVLQHEIRQAQLLALAWIALRQGSQYDVPGEIDQIAKSILAWTSGVGALKEA